jgi:hypothetical protein
MALAEAVSNPPLEQRDRLPSEMVSAVDVDALELLK